MAALHPTGANTTPGRRSPSEQTLTEIVRRIVDAVQPEKIILFGSAARGEMGPHSDLDLLVVKGGDYPKFELAGEIRAKLLGLGEAIDIIMATPEELERYGDCSALVYYPALRDGRVLYAV